MPDDPLPPDAEPADEYLPQVPAGGLFAGDDAEETEERAQANRERKRRAFAGVPPPPTGASPLLALILSNVSDRATRRAIEEAVWGLSDGNSDHLLTRAAALFSGIGQAQEARLIRLLEDFTKVSLEMHLYAVARDDDQGRGANQQDLSGLGRQIGDELDAQFALIRNAATEAKNHRLFAFVVAAFFAGMAVMGLIIFLFH